MEASNLSLYMSQPDIVQELQVFIPLAAVYPAALLVLYSGMIHWMPKQNKKLSKHTTAKNRKTIFDLLPDNFRPVISCETVDLRI